MSPARALVLLRQAPLGGLSTFGDPAEVELLGKNDEVAEPTELSSHVITSASQCCTDHYWTAPSSGLTLKPRQPTPLEMPCPRFLYPT